MKIDRHHLLVLASLVFGIAAAVLIAHAGTAGSYDAEPVPSQMIVPF